MENRFLVRSEHLNHQGHLFGGDLMAEIDTLGFCLVRERYPEKTLVTRAATISFDRPARLGDVIAFRAEVETEGFTSVRVDVTGWVGDVMIAQARLVYVNVGPDGQKAPLRP